MSLIGYASVSTEDQPPCPRLRPCKLRDALRSSKSMLLAEIARVRCLRVCSNASRAATHWLSCELTGSRGSLSHLLEVIERLEAKGAFSRSIQDPIDTASPQGKFTLQAICDRLESMRERTPRGRTSWQPSSVRILLERAERLGLL